MKYLIKMTVMLLNFSLLLLAACVSNPHVSDADLQRHVEIAIENASDLPRQLQVEVNSGVVRLTGSLQCENCGGNATPGQQSTIQQSLGAVIRSVPGVTHVEFYLNPS